MGDCDRASGTIFWDCVGKSNIIVSQVVCHYYINMKIGSSYSYAIIVLSSIVGITSTAAASDNVPRPIPLEREEDTAANSNGDEDARYLR